MLRFRLRRKMRTWAGLPPKCTRPKPVKHCHGIGMAATGLYRLDNDFPHRAVWPVPDGNAVSHFTFKSSIYGR